MLLFKIPEELYQEYMTVMHYERPLDEEEIPVLTKALDNLYQFFKTYNG